MSVSIPEFDHASEANRRSTLLPWKARPRRIPLHRHRTEAEIGFVTSGTGQYRSGERDFELGPGRLYFVAPGVPHGSPGTDGLIHSWTLSIPVDRIEPSVAAHFGASAATVLTTNEARRLGRLFEDLALEPDGVAFQAGATYVAASALATLGRAWSDTRTAPTHPAVDAATQILAAESGNTRGLSLDALARRCGASRSALTASFREHHGVSIVRFRNRERVRRFQELFEANPDLGMMRAAFEVGFGSYSQFYRTFRDVVGCTPADYARLHGRDASVT